MLQGKDISYAEARPSFKPVGHALEVSLTNLIRSHERGQRGCLRRWHFAVVSGTQQILTGRKSLPLEKKLSCQVM